MLKAHLKYSLSFLLFAIFIAISADAQDSASADTAIQIENLKVGESKSDYSSIPNQGGSNSVDAVLIDDDKKKDAWFTTKFQKKFFNPYYKTKRNLKNQHNIALGMDYMFLNQFATYSTTQSQASSGIFRVFGTWGCHFKSKATYGALIGKLENRHNIGTGVTPRNLGYDMGAALSTASFKDFSWGLTNLYWRQSIKNEKYNAVIGIMDPGDWLDLYPKLNPFKYYLNEAFFNSPAMSIPNQGLGVVFSAKQIYKNFYASIGMHDANGEPTNFVINNFKSFFKTNEYLYWVEAGWNTRNSITAGETYHVMYWTQDARVVGKSIEDQTEQSSGICVSGSKVINNDWCVFLRAGVSQGNAPLMRYMIMGGFTNTIFRHDEAGIGFHYGAPSQLDKKPQLGAEIFYAFQITEILNIMPDLQLTFNPSFTDQRNVLGLFSVVRLRIAI